MRFHEGKDKCMILINFGTLNQIEFQKFDIVFFEKIYTEPQFGKLKLLSNEKIIVTSASEDLLNNFDFILSSEGIIR